MKKTTVKKPKPKRTKTPTPASRHVRIVARKPELPQDPILKQSGAVVHSRAIRFPIARTLMSAYQAAKATFQPSGGLSSLWRYWGMNENDREYYRNWLVRKSIDTLAYWTTKDGYETRLEPVKSAGMTPVQKQDAVKQYLPMKDEIDQINHDVDFDSALLIAATKVPIHGRAGFEIERGYDGDPSRLIPLDSYQLEPLIRRNWTLAGFSYEGKGTLSQPFYQPEELVYFINADLSGDLKGISQVEPILKEAELDDQLVREDLAEALTVMWAGVGLLMLDRTKLANASDEDAKQIIDAMANQLSPGHWVVAEDVWNTIIADIKPNLDQMLNVSDKLERRIIGNFGVPRFLLNIEKELNRATAYAELEGYVEGPVTAMQRRLKRQVEAQWYDPLLRKRLGLKEARYHDLGVKLRRYRIRAQKTPLPVLLKHDWHEVRTMDWFELMDVISRGVAAGWIDIPKAYEMARKGKATKFNPEELDKRQVVLHQPIQLPERPRREQAPKPPEELKFPEAEKSPRVWTRTRKSEGSVNE